MSEQQHAMIFGKTHSTGADEWFCPMCGRRILMDYEPKLRKEVLEIGDESAVHSGGKGGLRMGPMKVAVDGASTENARLAPWEAWLNEMGFEDLWNSDIQ